MSRCRCGEPCLPGNVRMGQSPQWRLLSAVSQLEYSPDPTPPWRPVQHTGRRGFEAGAAIGLANGGLAPGLASYPRLDAHCLH